MAPICSDIARTYSRTRRSSAFTLLELLVVIAIIALLISILLPSLEAARRASKNSACLAHIKNIATCSRVYEADDPNGWAIPVHPLQFQQDRSKPTYVGAYEWGGKSGIGQQGYISGGGGAAILSSKYGTRAGFGPGTRPMNDLLYPGGFRSNYEGRGLDRRGAEADTQLALDLFKCPADDGPPRGAHCEDWIRKHPQRSSFDYFGNSFAANIFMVTNLGGQGCFQSNSPYLRPTSRVPNPARTLNYEENIGRWAWAVREDPCDFLKGVDPGPTKIVRGWHGRDWTFNRAFVDAHAETQRIYFDGTEDNEGYANHYKREHLPNYPPFILTCDDLEGNDGQTQQERDFNYRCVIIRGPGWAKDTLPSPFIQTGLMWEVRDDARPSYEDCVSSEWQN